MPDDIKQRARQDLEKIKVLLNNNPIVVGYEIITDDELMDMQKKLTNDEKNEKSLG